MIEAFAGALEDRFTGSEIMDAGKKDKESTIEQKKKKKPASVVSLYRYPQKRSVPVEEDCLICEAGAGIVGDWHADGRKRQVSLLAVEEKIWMQEQEQKGICFERYNENIVLAGMDMDRLRPGAQLVFEEVILELADFQKKCFPEVCELAARGGWCPLAGKFLFAFVRKSGRIRKGERVYDT